MHKRTVIGVLLSAAAGCFAQAPAHPTGARELYFAAASGREAPHPEGIGRSEDSGFGGGSAGPQAGSRRGGFRVRTRGAPSGPTLQSGARGPRLGKIRIGQLSDRVFKTAIAWRSNSTPTARVIFTYWPGNPAATGSPCFHRPEMNNEANIINPGQKVRTPQGYCFSVSDPPGTETLFCGSLARPAGFLQLYQSNKSGQGAPAAQPAPGYSSDSPGLCRWPTPPSSTARSPRSQTLRHSRPGDPEGGAAGGLPRGFQLRLRGERFRQTDLHGGHAA